ncbi:diguanylate cyclase domain-containing protein [Ramlibacter sp. AN1133]|uniref:diguanylate cyclase domain-containing protein n=1 Tax=Ramlibacter sp. AN1133 TaxID=3133429 RepID=UPI0030C1B3F4
MDKLTLMLWCMALGAIGAVALARTGDLAGRPSVAKLRVVGYHVSVFLLVLVLSGVLRHAAQPGPARLQLLQVLAGPVCVALASFWIHGWLAAGERDRLMAAVLRLSAFALPLLALAILRLPEDQQLPAAAALSLAGSALACWLTFRAWILGDRLALAMAAGCMLTLPALAGLYALAMHPGAGSPLAQAGVALAATVSNALTGRMLWRRERHAWRTRETGSVPAVDPVTRVHSSAALVHRLVQSQQRRRRTRREGALVAVTVFDADRIATQVGAAGLHEVWMTVAARLQRQVGVVNPVGRYWDRCFVALVETIPAPGWLRGLGLRLARSLRRPIEVTGRDGEPVRVQVDVGIGVVHLPAFHPEVEDVLDQAQRLAEAARGMHSRAATADPASGRPVPIEEARWGRRQRRRRERRADARLALQ